MPAYANADGKVICYFQGAEKSEARYATFGFNDAAFVLTKLTETEENIIKELVKKAVG